MRRARLNLNCKIATGNGFGNGSHFFQIIDHLGEGAREFSDFVLAFHVDAVIEVAGVADLPRNLHQFVQRFDDGFGGSNRDPDADNQGNQRTDDGEDDGERARCLIGLAPGVDQLAVFSIGHIEGFRQILYPRGSVFLEVVNLQFGHGRVA